SHRVRISGADAGHLRPPREHGLALPGAGSQRLRLKPRPADPPLGAPRFCKQPASVPGLFPRCCRATGRQIVSAGKQQEQKSGNKLAIHCLPRTRGMRAMADRAGLRIIGVIVASITGVVMLIAAVMVHKTMAGASTLEVP